MFPDTSGHESNRQLGTIGMKFRKFSRAMLATCLACFIQAPIATAFAADDGTADDGWDVFN